MTYIEHTALSYVATSPAYEIYKKVQQSVPEWESCQYYCIFYAEPD